MTLSLASTAYGRLRNSMFSNRRISKRLKTWLYRAFILPIAIYGAEVSVLQSQQTQSLEVFEMRCHGLSGVTSTDRSGLDMFAICIVRQAYKQDFKGQQKRGKPLKRWSDQFRGDTGLRRLTAEQYAVNRAGRRGAT